MRIDLVSDWYIPIELTLKCSGASSTDTWYTSIGFIKSLKYRSKPVYRSILDGQFQAELNGGSKRRGRRRKKRRRRRKGEGRGSRSSRRKLTLHAHGNLLCSWVLSLRAVEVSCLFPLTASSGASFVLAEACYACELHRCERWLALPSSSFLLHLCSEWRVPVPVPARTGMGWWFLNPWLHLGPNFEIFCAKRGFE